MTKKARKGRGEEEQEEEQEGGGDWNKIKKKDEKWNDEVPKGRNLQRNIPRLLKASRKELKEEKEKEKRWTVRIIDLRW